MTRVWKRTWRELTVLSSDDMLRTEGYQATAGLSGTHLSIVQQAQKLS